MPTKNEDKIDMVKLHKAEYSTAKKPKIIETTKSQYLVAQGQGQPGGDDFQNKIGALYAMAYTAKFQSKFAGQDYTVCKLEAIYGIDGQDHHEFCTLPPEEWKWKLLIRVPDFITKKHLAEARAAIRERGKDEGFLDDVQLETIHEGKCVQMLHVGPYDEEQRTIDVMHEFARGEGFSPHQWHHEIYISDPRRVPPERLKTILRHPVKKA